MFDNWAMLTVIIRYQKSLFFSYKRLLYAFPDYMYLKFLTLHIIITIT